MSASLTFDFATQPVPITGKVARPYQTACWEAIRQATSRGIRRQLAVLWPSLGKSYIAAHLPEQLGLHRMLALAHRKELIDQLAAELHDANPGAAIAIEQGDRREGSDESDIVVGSVPTLHRESRREKFKRPFDLIFMDECDLSLAPTFLRTLQGFGVGQPDGPLLVGMTGWFKRHDKKKASDLFDEVVFEKSLASVPSPIDEGWIVPHKAIRVRSKTDISHVAVFGGEFSQAQLQTAVDVPDRNDLIVSTICERPEVRERNCILVFVTGVEQARCIAEMLRQAGQSAEHVTGETNPTSRSGIFRRFADGKTRVLVNVDVLGRGNNIPRIDCVVMAHPTKSTTRYIQAMSRGGRLSPETGKTSVLIVDVVDVCGKHKVQTASQAFGVRDVDALGQDLREVAKAVKQAEATGTKLTDHDTIQDVQRKLAQRERYLVRKAKQVATTARAVDLFGQPSPAQNSPLGEHNSVFPWFQPQRGAVYALEVERGKWAEIRRDQNGCWVIDLQQEQPGGATAPIAGENLTSTAFADPDWQKADAFIRRHAGHWQPPGYRPRNQFDKGIARHKFLRSDSLKRQRPATPSQCDALRRWRQAVPDGLSFGVASDWLSRLVYEARHR